MIGPAKERSGFPGYAFGVSDDAVTPGGQEFSELPQTDAQGKAHFDVSLDQLPDTSRPLDNALRGQCPAVISEVE